jgi:hypothetical protein
MGMKGRISLSVSRARTQTLLWCCENGDSSWAGAGRTLGLQPGHAGNEMGKGKLNRLGCVRGIWPMAK